MGTPPIGVLTCEARNLGGGRYAPRNVPTATASAHDGARSKPAGVALVEGGGAHDRHRPECRDRQRHDHVREPHRPF
ncbi:hypothetical protein N869_05705 [Cellulomonas bogoriensis 69B4 = DSM 16987]|uniref:Uncharacterized protein n=1 Tax=Cellulomonas bogoriensis 69B4 = DSM 16987 TaxID=1386082 RepID=A0A0A0BR08_9CELL|nr:hypothetical protein N869_05705 [Cellulomonas bogoriensis 69B4 = DSM 16987]